ncbi:MAG: (Fe-S)-binding protein [Anaerolineaceae bacterium]|nr:(Fe-S)-binding protein [Anaerolineaceae bacterium]
MNESLHHTATVCAVCHDQCVSACPVVEATHRMSAYPSRLAMLALEVHRQGLPVDADLSRALLDCIDCGACLEGCLYVDRPNDVTPVVRWARQASAQYTPSGLQAWSQRVQATGSPYPGVSEQLAALKSALPSGEHSSPPLLLYVDAATLHYAPAMALAALQLLQSAGKLNVVLADAVYPGGEWYQYGQQDDFVAAARRLAGELAAIQPAKVVALNPYSAYLLREVYPAQAGVRLEAPVLTLAEALVDAIHGLPGAAPRKVFLVQSACESYRMGGGAGQALLEKAGAQVSGKRDELPFREISYPDGEVFGLEPDPRLWIQKRILGAFQRSGAEVLVTTSPMALPALRAAAPGHPVMDLATYLQGPG